MGIHFLLLSSCAVWLWWPPLSLFKGKRVFFLTSPLFQHLFRFSYNISNTVKRALHHGVRQFLPCRNRLLQPPLRLEASLGRLWLDRGGKLWHAKSCDRASLPPSGKTQNPTQDTVRARSLRVCGTCRLYLSCPYGEAVVSKLSAP